MCACGMNIVNNTFRGIKISRKEDSKMSGRVGDLSAAQESALSKVSFRRDHKNSCTSQSTLTNKRFARR